MSPMPALDLVRYPAPGVPELAARIRRTLRTAGMPVVDIPDRGLDRLT
ncbi:hypothetical protein [Streptomyces sp. BP-8]